MVCAGWFMVDLWCYMVYLWFEYGSFMLDLINGGTWFVYGLFMIDL